MEHTNNRRLNRQDFKTLSLAALGGALEFYDFIIFVFFAAAVTHETSSDFASPRS